MDSCQLFNFLFDTKKAKSELSKCFSVFRDKINKEQGSSGSSKQQQPHLKCPSSAPSSPLKQFRAKISSKFATSSSDLTKNDNHHQSIASSSSQVPDDHNNHVIKASVELCKEFKQDDNNHQETVSPEQTCDDEQHELYRANLVQSISFDQDLGIIIRESSSSSSQPTSDNPKESSSTANQCLEQLQSQDDGEIMSSSITTVDSNCDDSINDVVHDDNKTMRRIILYAANDDGDSGVSNENSSVRRLPNVCSTAEVFNMINTDHVVNYDNEEADSCNNHDDMMQSGGGIKSSINVFNNNIGEVRSKTIGARSSSFRQRNRSSSLVRTLVQSFEDRTDHHSTSFQNYPTSTSPIQDLTGTTASQVCDILNHHHQANRSQSLTTHDNTLNLIFNQDTKSRARTSPNSAKPISLVKPLPPKAPPKSMRARCITMQLSLDKPAKVDKLFLDGDFLRRFFVHLEPLDRCRAAQVCCQWRQTIYSVPELWRDLTMVIDYCQLRRDLVLDRIISALESVKFTNNNNSNSNQRKQLHSSANNNNNNYTNQQQLRNSNINNDLNQNQNITATKTQAICQQSTNNNADHSLYDTTTATTTTTSLSSDKNSSNNDSTIVSSCSRESSPSLNELDLDEVWRIQELCNRLANRPLPTTTTTTTNPDNNNNISCQQQDQKQQFTSQSTSIPSQISSTLSSGSLSSILSPPFSDGFTSFKMDLSNEKLYESIARRQFDSICLSGACNEDLDDFLSKFVAKQEKALGRVQSLKLRNTLITDKALANFLTHFSHIQELELVLCNCISNQIDLSSLKQLRHLTIQDCINITDDFAELLVPIGNQLQTLNVHAYHISDFFPDFLGTNCDLSKLTILRFPFCRELTDRSLMSIGKFYNSLEVLDLSGTKVGDDGIDFLANRAPTIKSLNLGWCANITDASIDFLALDLSETLTELVLDRNIHITDRAMKQLVKMNQLRNLHLRWCLRITDIGIEYLLLIDSLRYLSIAGLHQITSRSLLKLPESGLIVIELTNCRAVNSDLIALLSDKMPNCNIIH